MTYRYNVWQHFCSAIFKPKLEGRRSIFFPFFLFLYFWPAFFLSVPLPLPFKQGPECQPRENFLQLYIAVGEILGAV